MTTYYKEIFSLAPFGHIVQLHSPYCFELRIIFSEPNDESAANVDAAKIWREDRAKFNDVAQRTVRKSLGL